MAVLTFDKVAVLCAFFASIVFMTGYTILAPWWRHPVGRAIVSLDFALSAALTPSVLRLLFGVNIQTLWFAWYYGLALLSVAAITLWRLWVIFAVQRDALAPRHPPQPEPRYRRRTRR